MELLTPQPGLIFCTILTLLICFPLWLIALISILKNNFRDSTTKLTWVLVVLLVPLIGSVLYLAIGRNQIAR
ncbi:MAG: PLDc N-terminal domain-containing protein [Chitinophagaceae bacterium]|nr:PLDc N-terminal domain-containing protein [Chitinophagaceae bacterium]